MCVYSSTMMLFLVLLSTLYLCMFSCQVMSTNDTNKHSEQICKIFVCWKCWQLYLSINISWKRGNSGFSEGGNILKEFHISAYIQVIYLKSKIYRTLKKYLSFKEKWTFSLKSKYVYQLLFLVLCPIYTKSVWIYTWFGTIMSKSTCSENNGAKNSSFL